MKNLCSQRRLFCAFDPHIFSDIKMWPDFDFQQIFTKIGRKLAKSISSSYGFEIGWASHTLTQPNCWVGKTGKTLGCTKIYKSLKIHAPQVKVMQTS